MAQTSSDIQDEYYNALVKDIEKTTGRLHTILLKELAKYSVNGKLVADKQKLAQLEATIRVALQQAGYTAAMDQFTGAFTAIQALQEGYYQKQGLSIAPLLGDSELIKNTQLKIIDDIRVTGANKAIVNTLAEQLRQGILLGSDYETAAKALENTLIEKKLPVKYVEQVTKDAIKRYNGAIQDEVRTRYKSTHFYYIGSLIETSRPFCDHMSDKFGSREISYTELDTVLAEYCPGGQPSKSMTTYTTVNGVTETKPKGSGMKENTFSYNFSQNRGGWECRHDAQPIIPKREIIQK